MAGDLGRPEPLRRIPLHELHQADGLGDPIVNDIVEDRKGRLWVATNGGGVARLNDDNHAPNPGSAPEKKFTSFHISDWVRANRMRKQGEVLSVAWESMHFDQTDTLMDAVGGPNGLAVRFAVTIDERIQRAIWGIENTYNRLGTVVEEPVKVEQALIDDVLVDRPLVLEDDRAAVLIEPEGVDAAAVLLAGGVLAGDEANSEERFHVALDEHLERPLQRECRALQLDSGSVLDAEEL